MGEGLPDGLRLYVIGDVHGCADKLAAIHHMIDADLLARPVRDWRILHVGDYVDRGPDSRAVIDRLAARCADPRWICLRGNHDQMLLDCLADPGGEGLILLLGNGGAATLASYGVEPPGMADLYTAGRRREIGQRLARSIPKAHRAFLRGLPLRVAFGPYLFVHAGIRPGRPLAAQEAHDLLWIRGPFLESAEDHGAIVVHGHTPVDRVERHPNRIALDTGAVFGGPLSCLVLERGSEALLSPSGPMPLTPC